MNAESAMEMEKSSRRKAVSFRMLTAGVTTGLVALSILVVSQTSESQLRRTLAGCPLRAQLARRRARHQLFGGIPFPAETVPPPLLRPSSLRPS